MQRRRTTKELIADSFLELSEKKSVDKITVKEIIANCGLTTTTFYNHFHDKYDLMIWIYATSAEKIMNRIGKDGYQWRDTLSDGVKYAIENKNFLVNAIEHTSGYDSFINNISKVNLKVFLECIKSSGNFKEIPADIKILAKIYVYGTVCMMCEWLIGENFVAVEDFVKLLEDALPAPLKKYLY